MVTLVRVLAIGFMSDEDVGQAALDVEMTSLMQGYLPRNRMTHRSTSYTVKDLPGHELASRLRTRSVPQLLHTSRREHGGKERISDARDWIGSHAFIVGERVIIVLKVRFVRRWFRLW